MKKLSRFARRTKWQIIALSILLLDALSLLICIYIYILLLACLLCVFSVFYDEMFACVVFDIFTWFLKKAEDDDDENIKVRSSYKMAITCLVDSS